MKFSEQWLREWVNPAISTNELSEQLSMAGLEVDDVSPVAEAFTGVVVGEVVECEQHPDADKLQVTKINVGGDELLDIVCGAPNCRLGIKVAVAMVGAVLPGNFKIKKAKLRGQPSFGMLCSFSELGMGDDHSGIMELPLDAPIGADLRTYLDLDDKSIEVDLTPNRADCLGMKGIAREVGVLNQLDVTEPKIPAVPATINDARDIKLAAPQACPRYLGRVIKGVDLSRPSPLWMQEKLRRSGTRSIDAVVDVTNYVLLELGHPMHAFDNAKLEGDVVVRMAEEGEKLTLLDENEVSLKANTLVIADSTKALAMAGIFGGLDSGVTSSTTDIFLESAFFAPDAIMGKARQYGLHTDASHRYERGVDPSLQLQAMERATQLLIDAVGGSVGPVIEAKDETHLPKAKAITLRAARLSHVLGIDIAPDRVTDILNRLGLEVTSKDGAWEVVAPLYRFDMNIEEDLIEEVARVYGYNNIPNQAPVASLQMRESNEANVATSRFKDLLIDQGFQEAITYSFVDPKKQTMMFPDVEGLALPHPISADMSVMRVSLLPGLLSALSYNQKRQQSNIKLFETGLRFTPDAAEKSGVQQQEMIAGVMSGNVAGEHWTIPSLALDFFDVKAVTEELIGLSIDAQDIEFRAEKHTAFHPGQCAGVYKNDKCIGFVGAIHPKLEKGLGLSGKTFAFELELVSISTRALPWIKAISKFPVNRRDIAVTVEDSVDTGNILKCIEKLGVTDLIDLNLFDVYKGKGIEPGFKSLALSIWLQSSERTLEDADIQKSVDTVVQALEVNFSASLRD
ncbi:phenylalanine--tRNA ligase subunit beta [Brumicola nitratireducens]|uniref:Phenylalanine--tRNA ligase beta subunit n=1 Tax=Glaciecola nitratireducens (strain JCM 12485 / KCTC 12276 / FR1064) TaxID=1085623 RepID=G4QLB9_GLANF|nr:phenylalanine--tRNA ligase subunit beta [Glaciecola nitratireducens]AEP29786.1 phenylalanyl-tRNA synthetase subunit beta [Glaciecola nitratireducens FR1064]